MWVNIPYMDAMGYILLSLFLNDLIVGLCFLAGGY